MFERNIEETIAFLRKETIEGADSITSRQIFASSIPPALTRMFETDIDIWVREEKERLQQSPHFRYDEEEMQNLFDQIGERARDYAQFTAAEYHTALDKNVKLLFNYVCRPQWTLIKYLFAEREHAATDDLLEALKTFWHYEYYQIILREYFDKKKISVIHVKKFTELIEQIDLEVVRNFDSRKTAHLSEPLFELFNIGAMREDAMAPIEALSIFYDDKNIPSIVERLDHEKQNHEMMTLHDLVLLISDADFTLGVDISSIVSEKFTKQGVMKPERNITAGEDFEVPPISDDTSDDFHHGDLGHENDDLDFVISDEEEGVIVQDGDHITQTIEDKNELTRDDLSISDYEENSPEMEEQIAEIPAYDADSVSVEEVSEDEIDTVINADSTVDDDASPDDDSFSYTDESILNLEEEFDTTSNPSAEERLDSEIEGIKDGEIPDLYLADDQPSASQSVATENIEIPDITLEELGTTNFGDEGDAISNLDKQEDDVDPYMTSAVIDDELAGADIILDDRDETKPTSEDEIDWDKEAEDLVDMGDLDIDEDASISDLLPEGEDPFKEEASLKPAEELLGQLDFDDLDEEPDKKPVRQNDFPIVEDDTPFPRAQRAQVPDPVEEIEEDSAATADVIKEFGDLNQLLLAADKKKYVKKLFQKNDDALNRAIQVLNGKATWRQASEYIDELFIKHDVDMYSRLAVKFTDDVYKRYANQK